MEPLPPNGVLWRLAALEREVEELKSHDLDTEVKLIRQELISIRREMNTQSTELNQHLFGDRGAITRIEKRQSSMMRTFITLLCGLIIVLVSTTIALVTGS